MSAQGRKVARNRTVSLDGTVYEDDAALVGEAVTLRFAPSRPGRPLQVWVKGLRAGDAKAVDVHAAASPATSFPPASTTCSASPA